MRHHDEELVVRNHFRGSLDDLVRAEKAPAENPLPRAPDRILRNEQRAKPHAPAVGVERVVARKRKGAPFHVDQVGAKEWMPHLRDSCADRTEDIVEFAIAHRLEIAARRVKLGDYRFAREKYCLAAAQRVAAVDVQAGFLFAQRTNLRRNPAMIVQIGGVIYAHYERACATTNAAN